MDKWFCYDGESFATFGTPEDAETYAQDALNWRRDQAGEDGWPDDTEAIRWGRIHGAVVETTREPCDHGQFDEIVDYALKAVD